MPQILVTGSDRGIKSIPLNKLPEEAWRYIRGESSGGTIDIYALYETVPWLYRGTEARCNAVSGIPVGIHQGDESGEEIEENDLPFELHLSDLLETITRHYILSGAWYIYPKLNVFDRVLELQVFHPSSMKPQYDYSGLTGFKRTVGSQEITYTTDELVWYFKPPHRTEVGIGIPDAVVAAQAAGVLRHMSAHVDTHFKQGAVNPTVISAPEETSDQDLDRLESWYNRMLTGIKNAFKIRVVRGEVKATQLGYPLKDLAARELTMTEREDIATALGVPQTLMFSNAANYATAEQDDLHFYDKTVLPNARRFVERLNKTIFKPLGYFLKLHPERMELYQKLESEKAYAVTALAQSEIMETWESRAQFNLPPVPVPPPGWEAWESKHPRHVAANKQGTPDSPEELVADTVTPPDTASKATPLTKELGQWQKMATTRFKEGKPTKAIDFTPAVIPASLAAAIRGGLKAAKGVDGVAAVFQDAHRWVGYP